MLEFKKPTNHSVGNKKLLHGVGENDAEYQVYCSSDSDGKKAVCPYYTTWSAMIERCYSSAIHKIRPRYKKCSVDKRWHKFSAFKEWMGKQDWKGKQLDKDILIQGNKVYSPESCLFVSKRVNTLLNSSEASRGEFPVGVTYHSPNGKYRAKCRHNGKTQHLGLYNTVKEAAEAYKKFKYSVIREVAMSEREPLKTALLRYEIR